MPEIIENIPAMIIGMPAFAAGIVLFSIGASRLLDGRIKSGVGYSASSLLVFAIFGATI